MSREASVAVAETREIVKDFFRLPSPFHFCFTKNATEALNIGIKGILKKGEHVITTSMEHNSVLRPLKTLQKNKVIKLTILGADAWGQPDPDELVNSIRIDTALIVCTLSSNVNGTIMPYGEFLKTATAYGIPFMLDASQGAGSIELNLNRLQPDLLAFPGHKGLMGPQGIGGLCVKDRACIKPLMEGGTGSQSENFYQPSFMPDHLESGTLNTPGIVGLGKGIQFIKSVGMDEIKKHKYALTRMLHGSLREIRNLLIYSIDDPTKNSGITAFNFKGIDSQEVERLLDSSYGICSRSGLHCAPLAHKILGTLNTGIVRLSPGYFNTEEEIFYVIRALEEISIKVLKH